MKILVCELLAQCHKLSQNHNGKILNLHVYLLCIAFSTKVPPVISSILHRPNLNTNHKDEAVFWGILVNLCCFSALDGVQGNSCGMKLPGAVGQTSTL